MSEKNAVTAYKRKEKDYGERFSAAHVETNYKKMLEALHRSPEEVPFAEYLNVAGLEATEEAPQKITTAETAMQEARKAWSQAEEYSAAAIDAEIAGDGERAAHLYRLGTEALHRHADLLHAAYMARSN